MSRSRSIALASLTTLVALASGCRTPAEVPQDVEPRAMYQAIANALPRASFGWGTPPGVVTMSASAKAEGAVAEPEQPVANERQFRLIVEVYRPRNVSIPYSAIEQVHYGWRPFPNALLAPLIVLPVQLVRATVVFDAAKVSGFLSSVEHDIKRLEQISREVGLGGPWSHAQDVKEKLADDAAEYGPGRVSVNFDYVVIMPAAIPMRRRARETAEAFAWCQANPTPPPTDTTSPPR